LALGHVERTMAGKGDCRERGDRHLTTAIIATLEMSRCRIAPWDASNGKGAEWAVGFTCGPLCDAYARGSLLHLYPMAGPCEWGSRHIADADRWTGAPLRRSRELPASR
jgi:hypothetical protein